MCRGAGIDPTSAKAGGAWLAGPVALLAGARSLAASLDDLVESGRPLLPLAHLRGRLDDRVAARLEPRTLVERILFRRTEVFAIFEQGVEPEDVIAGQAAFYRQRDPEGGVARVRFDGGPPSAGALSALSALFVEGKVAIVEASPSRAHLIPAMERALGPLVDRGFVRLVEGGEDAAPAREARSPLVVTPCFYARDELWFTARRVASAIVMGAALDCAAPRVLVIAEHWAQRGLFLETMQRALDTLAPREGGWALREKYDGGALAAGEIGVIAEGGEDAVAALDRAPAICNEVLGGAPAAEIMIHPIQEEEPAVFDALARAVARLKAKVVGVNQWPALLDFRRDERMLPRVEKLAIRGPIHALRRPVYFADNARGRAVGEAMAAFMAAPGAGALLKVVRA